MTPFPRFFVIDPCVMDNIKFCTLDHIFSNNIAILIDIGVETTKRDDCHKFRNLLLTDPWNMIQQQ